MKKQTIFVLALMSLISFASQASELKIQGAMPVGWKIKNIMATYGDDNGVCGDGKNRDVTGDVKSKNGLYSAKIKFKEFVKIRYAVFFTCRQYLDFVTVEFSSLDAQNNEITNSFYFKSTSNAELVNVPSNADQNIFCTSLDPSGNNKRCMPVGLNQQVIYIPADGKLNLQGWNISL